MLREPDGTAGHNRVQRVRPEHRVLREPTRPQGTVPDDSFASFINYQMQLMPDSLIVLFPDITDSTGNIASADLTHIRLEPGCYLISYEVSVVFNSANYMQVTPSYNGPRTWKRVFICNAHRRLQRLRIFFHNFICALFNGIFPYLFRLCRRPGRSGYAYYF